MLAGLLAAWIRAEESGLAAAQLCQDLPQLDKGQGALPTQETKAFLLYVLRTDLCVFILRSTCHVYCGCALCPFPHLNVLVSLESPGLSTLTGT